MHAARPHQQSTAEADTWASAGQSPAQRHVVTGGPNEVRSDLWARCIRVCGSKRPKRQTDSASSPHGCPSTSCCRSTWPARLSPTRAPSGAPLDPTLRPGLDALVHRRPDDIDPPRHLRLSARFAPPLHHGRAFGTLDWVSGGRAVIGAGAGWLRSEWEALGIIRPPGAHVSTRQSRCADDCGPRSRSRRSHLRRRGSEPSRSSSRSPSAGSRSRSPAGRRPWWRGRPGRRRSIAATSR